MIKHALILAAGRGLRMMPLTSTTSKAMIQFNNAMLIGNSLKQLVQSDLKTISITVGYKGAELAEYAIKEGVHNIFNTNGKGNAWWLYHTLLKQLDEPLLVLTCDNIVEIDFDWIFQQYQQLNSPACMLVPVQPVEGIEGDFIQHHNGKITKLSRTEITPIYGSGIQILNPKKINKTTNAVENFYEVWQQLIAKELLYASETYTKPWFSINTEVQLRSAEKLYKALKNES
ncbi:nucleotidyltransferase-like protein [Kordia periserrulae]|uniref:Nucleotidyltransferase-like protein n=1 Tax=Kordia periserrulae TaxID=701523 RepID=A0A2T6BSA0_9FLAO|nr:sugar phosphate nucleotidyltransferase [Kordia periserrulae]PTX58965.1 nucleotidyltransferase-like protein [Kordia periserrulae]